MDDFRKDDRRQRVLGCELIVRKAPPHFVSMRFPAYPDKPCHLGILICRKAELRNRKEKPALRRGRVCISHEVYLCDEVQARGGILRRSLVDQPNHANGVTSGDGVRARR